MSIELLTPKEAEAFLKVSTVTLAKGRAQKKGAELHEDRPDSEV